MQKIGHWILEYDEQSFFNENVYLYWVVGDESSENYKTRSFCIGYNDDTNNIGFICYVGNNWNKDIEIIETITNGDYPWSKILLLSEVNGGKENYSEQYYFFIQFINEVDKNEVKRLIQKELIDDLL